MEEIAKSVHGTLEPDYQTHVLRTVSEKRFLVDCNLHFLSRVPYFGADGIPDLHSSNRIIVNWLHGGLNSANPGLVTPARTLQKHWHTIDRLVVPNSVTRSQVLECGVDERMVRVIPNGVDTEHFKPPPNQDVRLQVRLSIGIPEDAFVIGSFQRDGNDEGEPKLEKGPDTLVDTIAAIHGRRPVFLLLTGSGRRYVTERLNGMGVPFAHQWVEPYADMVKMYHALDLYLVTSREEGGPTGLRESMASGVPVVSTRMGLAADIVQHGVNGLLAEVEDSEGLAAAVLQLMSNTALCGEIIENAHETIQQLDYKHIVERYRQVYAEVFN